MSINLRVRNTTTGVTRTIRFPEAMSVHEATKTILEKSVDSPEGSKDHAIFKPLTDSSGTKGGKWLRIEKTLEFYDLKSNVRRCGLAIRAY